MLFQTVMVAPDYYLDDYVSDYPDRINLIAAMYFAHEMTHIWQWQNRELTGYHPAALDPEGARTARLERMLGQVMDLTPVAQRADRPDVLLPWQDAELEGICS